MTDGRLLRWIAALPFRVLIKKNNVQWLENDTKIHYSVERLFTRATDFKEELLNEDGAFVDILRVVSERSLPVLSY